MPQFWDNEDENGPVIPMDLHTACSCGEHSYVQELLDGGADVNRPNVEHWTPLAYACYGGHDTVAYVPPPRLGHGSASIRPSIAALVLGCISALCSSTRSFHRVLIGHDWTRVRVPVDGGCVVAGAGCVKLETGAATC